MPLNRFLTPRGQARIGAAAAIKEKRPVIPGRIGSGFAGAGQSRPGCRSAAPRAKYLSIHHRLAAWLTAVARMGTGTSNPRTITRRVTLRS